MPLNLPEMQLMEVMPDVEGFNTGRHAEHCWITPKGFSQNRWTKNNASLKDEPYVCESKEIETSFCTGLMIAQMFLHFEKRRIGKVE